MRKVLFVFVLVLVGAGFYRGWFALSSHERDEGNKVDVKLTVDSDATREDAETVKHKTAALRDRATDTVKQDHITVRRDNM